MKGLSWGLLVLLVGCNGAVPAPPKAKFWTIKTFVDEQGTAKRIGGWAAEDLLVKEGAPLRFQNGNQLRGWGLPLFPGVSEGKVFTFTITEVWQAHPAPWVQPVWLPAFAKERRNLEAGAVFPVGLESTFYSPFWEATFVLGPEPADGGFRDSRSVLAAGSTLVRGDHVLCPFVPEVDGGVVLAAAEALPDGGTRPLDPVTLTEVRQRQLQAGWVDGRLISYLDFGNDKAPTEGQTVIEETGYFFVRELSVPAAPPLQASAVLPVDPVHHALVRRVDVEFPKTGCIYLPPGTGVPESQREPETCSFSGPPADFAFRVIKDQRCFADGGFADCVWLDSVAAIEALPSGSRQVTDVQLAVWVVPR